jgi:hypothetical protein
MAEDTNNTKAYSRLLILAKILYSMSGRYIWGEDHHDEDQPGGAIEKRGQEGIQPHEPYL